MSNILADSTSNQLDSDKFSEAKQQALQVATQTKDQAKQIASDVTHAASDVALDAKQQTLDLLQRQKSNAANQISSFQAAVQNASNKLRDEQNPQLASYADAAAEKLGQLSDYLESQNLTKLMHDVERYARKRPEIVFGGLALAGLAAARFLKSSSSRSSASNRSQNSAPKPSSRRSRRRPRPLPASSR